MGNFHCGIPHVFCSSCCILNNVKYCFIAIVSCFFFSPPSVFALPVLSPIWFLLWFLVHTPFLVPSSISNFSLPLPFNL